MVPIILFVLVWAVVMVAMAEAVSLSTYGGHLNSSEVYEFLVRNKQEYVDGEASRNMFYGIPRLPYIAKTTFTATSGWYIKGYGLVWRWSKASEFLDQLHEELVPGVNRTQLKDL